MDRTRIILALQILQVGLLVYGAVLYGPRINALLTRAEGVAGKLEGVGL